MTKEAAATYKAKGNDAFKAKKFADAIEHFTNAIKEDDTDHVFYSNRSAAYVSSDKGDLALADAKKCIELKPTWARGYGRLGAAHVALGNTKDALDAYKNGLKVDPSNAGFKEEVATLETQMKRSQGGAGGLFGGAEGLTRLLTNPETAEMCKDQAFMQKLQRLGGDPMALIQEAQNDPRLMKAIQVMTGANMAGPQAETAPSPPPKAKEPEPTPEPEVELSKEEKDLKDLEAAAAEDKRLGTEAYKKKDFETALKYYSAGFEKQPTEMAFLSNQGSVFLEMKEYEKCIDTCHKAVEIGREARADFKKIAKVFGRVGTAYERMGKPTDAIAWYNKSLSEHRTGDILTKKQNCEKATKEAERNLYRDEAKADEEREKGNECLKKGEIPQAVKHYTESMRRNPDDVRALSNRAACYHKLMAPAQAIEDCEQIIKIDPTFVKGYTRKGDAQFLMKKHEEARMTYQEALKIEPGNQHAKDGIYRCNVAISAKEADMSPEQKRERAMKDPEIQEILRDPVMNSVLEQMQNDPGAVQEHLRNPAIAAKINKLVQAGILGTK